MSDSKMREEFEAEMVAGGKSIRRCQDSYHFGTIHRKWLFWQKAWQASRAVVVIELPEFDDYPTSMAREMRAELQKIIEAADLKVQP